MGDWFVSLDAYTKGIEGARSRTIFGAFVSVGSFLIMFFLFCSEFSLFMETDTEEIVFVDPSAGTSRNVSVDFSFHFDRIPCADAHIDMVDRAGKIGKSMEKNGVDVQDDDEKDGCIVSGRLRLRKVAGEFRIVAGHHRSEKEDGDKIVYGIGLDELKNFDATHTIERLQFGPDIPGRESPLSGYASQGDGKMVQYKYTIDLVPTQYVRLDGTIVDTHQYSAHMERISAEPTPGRSFQQPGIFFKYDFSPILIRYTERRRTFLQFVTSACAILGGVFTVSSMIDSCIYRSAMALKKID